jgi:hypothetical protein
MINTQHLWNVNEEIVRQREYYNHFSSNICRHNAHVHNRRFGKKWTINEELALQREYQLLKLSIPEIAQRHCRTQRAISFKLESEEFFIDENADENADEKEKADEDEKANINLIIHF